MAQTYARLTGDLWLDPGLAAIRDEAFRIYILAISYSAQQLTDGFVPHHICNMIPSSLDEPLRAQPWLPLVEAGLWLEVEGGYQIKGYLKHNKSRAEIEAGRAKNAERVTKHREAKESRVTSPPVTEPVTRYTDISNAPIEEELELEEEVKRESTAKRAKPRSRIPADWTPSDDLIEAMNAKHPGIDAASLVDRFRDFHISKGSLMADWNAAFRTWCGKETPRANPASLDQRRAWIAALTDEDIA
jgi:hypothetical protein